MLTQQKHKCIKGALALHCWQIYKTSVNVHLYRIHWLHIYAWCAVYNRFYLYKSHDTFDLDGSQTPLDLHSTAHTYFFKFTEPTLFIPHDILSCFFPLWPLFIHTTPAPFAFLNLKLYPIFILFTNWDYPVHTWHIQNTLFTLNTHRIPCSHLTHIEYPVRTWHTEYPIHT